MRTGTRDKAVVQPVSLPSSRTETWGKLLGSPARLCARFLARVSWCPGCVGGPWPLAFFSGSVCGSGPVVCSWPCCVVWFRPSGSVSKRGDDPGHRPKDRFLSDRPTTCRAGSPWWPGVRGDDSRTDLLAGTDFYERH